MQYNLLVKEFFKQAFAPLSQHSIDIWAGNTLDTLFIVSSENVETEVLKSLKEAFAIFTGLVVHLQIVETNTIVQDSVYSVLARLEYGFKKMLINKDCKITINEKKT